MLRLGVLLQRGAGVAVMASGVWSITLSAQQRQEAMAAAEVQLRLAWDLALPYLRQYMRQHEEALASAQLMALGEERFKLASTNQAIALASCCFLLEALLAHLLVGLAVHLLLCRSCRRREDKSPLLFPGKAPEVPAAAPFATPLRRRPSLPATPASAGSARRSQSPGLKAAPAYTRTPAGGIATPLWEPTPVPERMPSPLGGFTPLRALTPSRARGQREEKLVAMLNFSPLEELEKIKGIGKKTLQSIQRFRDRGQQFQRLEDLDTKLGLPSLRRFFPDMLKSV